MSYLLTSLSHLNFRILSTYFFFLFFIMISLSTFSFFFFLIDPAPTEIYPLPLHDALPIGRVADQAHARLLPHHRRRRQSARFRRRPAHPLVAGPAAGGPKEPS